MAISRRQFLFAALLAGSILCNGEAPRALAGEEGRDLTLKQYNCKITLPNAGWKRRPDKQAGNKTTISFAAPDGTVLSLAVVTPTKPEVVDRRWADDFDQKMKDTPDCQINWSRLASRRGMPVYESDVSFQKMGARIVSQHFIVGTMYYMLVISGTEEPVGKVNPAERFAMFSFLSAPKVTAHGGPTASTSSATIEILKSPEAVCRIAGQVILGLILLWGGIRILQWISGGGGGEAEG